MSKSFFVVILMFFILSIPLSSRVEPGQTRRSMPDDFSGFFVLQQNSSIRVSIDHGWERDGWIQVFLTFGGLEVLQRIKADDMTSAGKIETGISKMLVEDEDIGASFFTYEQNPMRTRMELLDKSKRILLKINRETRQVEVYFGNGRLKLKPICVKFTEITPGELYELTFVDMSVRKQKRFVYMPSRGIIYTASHRYTASQRRTLIKPYTDLDEKRGWSKWAIKVGPEEERLINQGERK